MAGTFQNYYPQGESIESAGFQMPSQSVDQTGPPHPYPLISVSNNSNMMINNGEDSSSGGEKDRNYDFLVEETEQQHLIRQIHTVRWANIAEKLGFRFSLKEVQNAIREHRVRIQEAWKAQERLMRSHQIEVPSIKALRNEVKSQYNTGIQDVVEDIRHENLTMETIVQGLEQNCNVISKLYMRECHRAEVLEQQLKHQQSLVTMYNQRHDNIHEIS